MSKTCSHCGAKLEKGQVFCGDCGNKVNKTIKITAKTKKILIIIGVIAVLFGLIFAYAYYQDYKENERISTLVEEEMQKYKDVDFSDMPTKEDIEKVKSAMENIDNNEVVSKSTDGTLKIGCTGAYPPFEYYDENNELVGFDVELAKYVCDYLGMRPEFVEINYDDKEMALKQGKIDCFWSGAKYEDYLTDKYYFSNIYITYEDDKCAVMFAKGDDMVSKINPAISSAGADGTISKLAEKYNIN